METRQIKYKKGNKVGNKRIVMFLASRGWQDHYYIVECIKCGKRSVMHQGALGRKQSGCKFCYRIKSRYWKKD